MRERASQRDFLLVPRVRVVIFLYSTKQTAIHRFPGHHALVAKGRLALDVILKGAGLTPLL